MPPTGGDEDDSGGGCCGGGGTRTPPPEYTENALECITVVSDTGNVSVPTTSTGSTSCPTTTTTTATTSAASTAQRRHRHRNHRSSRLSHYHHHHHHQHSLRHWARLHSPILSENVRGSSIHQSNNNSERSPFLIVKILLFSLMTIDFVMNTIGLAVIVVMAKNYFNNIMVERTLMKDHITAAETATSSQTTPYSDQVQSEWSLLLPLLPSFIFAEILTLIGMFGVFCDLFSFTMTYAILKLITSLCFPSMASAAAVAALTTTSAITTTTANMGHSLNNTVSLVPALLPEIRQDNHTQLAHSWRPNPHYNQVIFNVINSSSIDSSRQSSSSSPLLSSSSSSPAPPNLFQGDKTWRESDYIVNSSREPPLSSSSVVSSPKIEPNKLTTTSPTIHDMFDNNTESDIANPNSTDSSVLQSIISALNASTPAPYSPYMMLKSKQRLKDTVKEYRRLKKNDRMTKYKAREKQFQSKLLRMETAQYYSGPPIGISNQSRQKDGRWVDSVVSSPNYARLSLILPIDSHTHNIKYHHRVWDALLVTFEVIFAVAFAFNTLSSQSRTRTFTDEEDFNDEFEDIVEDGRSRRRRRRRHRLNTSQHWPYSPLATSIDAYYFAQFQLPPPPPPYFCRQSTPSCNSATVRATPTTTCQEPRNIIQSLLLNMNRLRRRVNRNEDTGVTTRQINQISTISTNVRTGNSPPQYEDIEHDQPVAVMVVGNPTSQTGTQANERIVLQVINQETVPNEPNQQIIAPVVVRQESNNNSNKSQTCLPTIPEEAETSKDNNNVTNVTNTIIDTRV